MSHEQDVAFTEGEEVRIKMGPFSGFTGTVHAISEDRRKLKVTVNIFGRRPAVEVFFLDAEKLGAFDYRRN